MAAERGSDPVWLWVTTNHTGIQFPNPEQEFTCCVVDRSQGIQRL